MVGDIEDVARRLMLDLVSDAFTVMLAAVDAEKGDGNVTPRPAAVFSGERRNVADLGYPIGEVVGVRTTYDQESGAIDALHEVAVIWTNCGSEELALTRELYRLVRATRDLFNRKVRPEVSSGVILAISEEYSELDRRAEGSGFVKGASILFHVPTYTT